MQYKIEYNKNAINSLRRLPRNIASLVEKKIELLAQNPYAKNNNALKLQGRDGYRLRVGDLRVFYKIEDDILVVIVVDIKFRGGAYQ